MNANGKVLKPRPVPVPVASLFYFVLLLGTAWPYAGSAADVPLDTPSSGKQTGKRLPLYTFTLRHDGSPESYDEATAVACLQGIINRKSPELYVLSRKNSRPQYWLDLLSKDRRWLQGRVLRPLADLGSVARLAGERLKGVVIWDPAVPASLNVATTIAGVEDGVVFSPEYADRFLKSWQLPVLVDLRGRFTGAETGSPKNDANRCAFRQWSKARPQE